MELVWDIYNAVLKDGSWIVDQYIRNDSLERRRKTLKKHCFSYYCDFKSDSVCYVHFLCLWSGLFRRILVPGTLAFHLLYTLIKSDCLVYSVSQSVAT